MEGGGQLLIETKYVSYIINLRKLGRVKSKKHDNVQIQMKIIKFSFKVKTKFYNDWLETVPHMRCIYF